MSIKSLNGADALTLQQMSQPAPESIRMSKDQMEAAKAFESYMVEMMVKEMRKTIPDGMFSGDSTEIFSGLFDQEISKRIAETGGFGFDEVMGKAASNLQEASARGARIILVTEDRAATAVDFADEIVRVPNVDPLLAPILLTVPVQILAYLTAFEKGTDVDQPRNLAKSVTVE